MFSGSEIVIGDGDIFKSNKDIYISLISDCSFPLIGLIPREKEFNKIYIFISEDKKTFNYCLKSSQLVKKDGNNYKLLGGGTMNNGIVFKSGDMEIPVDLKNRLGQDIRQTILNEIEGGKLEIYGDIEVEVKNRLGQVIFKEIEKNIERNFEYLQSKEEKL